MFAVWCRATRVRRQSERESAVGSPTGVDLERDGVDPDSSVELVTKQKNKPRFVQTSLYVRT